MNKYTVEDVGWFKECLRDMKERKILRRFQRAF